MRTKLHLLPIDERLNLVEDLWDSIAAERDALPLTGEQKAELDRRLARYETDRDTGRPSKEVIEAIRQKL